MRSRRTEARRLLRRLKPFNVWLNERPRTEAEIAFVRRIDAEIRRQAEHPDPVVLVSKREFLKSK